ncbi:GGDEF domain-containing protein [Secundilactobacillus folii]|uniref:Diguanylate cyclase n=1 Tax=Secundilactobacillus folii TaxID=2678357 RepID=A0A7X2XWU6_9LACO|nr:GGDEF domain-containing protein [Secundilactobacillus folii]MTV83081.1 diguanylate cyclase [Secundilactobacillus folii]
MVTWANRVVVFIMNTLLLTGFALMYWWLQHARFQRKALAHFRELFQILLTIGFLALFHFASVLMIINNVYRPGYGWNYLTFQIGILLFGLFFSHNHWLFISLVFTLLVWYWWLPNLPYWGLFFLASVALMWVADNYGRRLLRHPLYFYPFALLFGLPFVWANFLSLRGIDVGWLWQIGSMLIIDWLVWFIHNQLMNRSLREARLLREAKTDTLTQLNNFRVFNEDLETAFKTFKKEGAQYLVYTFDIDHFKRVNDRYGHLEGNEVLRQVASKLQQIVHGISYRAKAYRVGGEEFSFIIFDRERQQESTSVVANRVRQTLGALTFKTKKGASFKITISLGQDQVRAEDQNYLEAYKRADQKLYHSKQNGRNTVTVSKICQY